MYEKRVKVFLGISLAALLICMLRLAQLQLLTTPELQNEIAKATEPRGSSKQFKTLRGKILDRRGEILAADMPQFQICIDYSLSCFLDERVVLAKLAAAKMRSTNPSLYEVHKQVDDKRQDLERLIEKCCRFGVTREQVEGKIKALNDAFWNTRSFLAWVRGSPDPNLIAKYKTLNSVPLPEALAHFERQYPDHAERTKRITKVDVNDIPDLNQTLTLVDLKTEEDVFEAQLALLDVDDVQILPTGHRYYPYRSAAAQTIGWVGQATQPRDVNAFKDDPLARYRQGEVCGREDGVEYVCESILRGRRGEIVHDIDGRLVRETETEFGQDVQLTLDIELQRQIEQRLTDPKINPDYAQAPMAGAIIDVRSGDILALVSLPSYDLNAARYQYDTLRKDPNRPLINRTINFSLYPPGSVAKPVVLIAGLESGAITPEETISCPATPAPPGWPDCLIYRKDKVGHNSSWVNKARNAIKGSCNVYFSHLADRIEPRVLQEWFFRFGYGREVPLPYPEPPSSGSIPRRLRQASGQIGSTLASAYADIESVDQLPPLFERDRKMFGIGQGNFRVTPLQVANAFATLARRGRFLPPRLFLSPESPPAAEPNDLPISPTTLDVVYDGMYAVVNERGGSAYNAFTGSGLTQHGVKVYGKTGSTERPYDAWFAGFAEDQEGRKIALAVVVEGGQRGGGDVGPLAREILQLCVQQGYLGKEAPATAK
ncbi:MAG: penicillin-binding transpeptidase domain-containing protein [Phycisphaerae bacterium]|nr:penicillin-binding transpeptidase domain-containing protein [Phycisphaerae bacterium]